LISYKSFKHHYWRQI